jgi:hypothetical protein
MNENPYPVVDGTLYVKIFKTRSASDGNGPDVVDQFVAVNDIVIPALSSVPVSFSWKVPSYAQSGDYRLATFFLTSRKSALLGLPFTDDVVGNVVPFKVAGEQATGVSFDKAKVTVNDIPYRFAAFPPEASKQDPVTVKAVVKNSTAAPQQAEILWTIYQWDQQLRENIVQQESARVTVPARGSAPITVTVTDARYPVYLAVGTLKWQDTQSIIGVRFSREGMDRLRLNFPSIMSFPLRAGEENTLFSCLHNAGVSPVVPGGRLELTLADKKGAVIEEYTYTGDVTGAMRAVAEKFTPKKDYDYFTLDARLYRGNDFVDEAHLVYDCERIDPTACKPEGSGSFLSLADLEDKILWIIAGGGALVIIVLVMIIQAFRRRWAPPQPPAF